MIFNLYNDRDVAAVKNAYTGKVVGLTSGSYDLLHAVHDDYLDCCRRHCGHEGILIVGVDSDHLIRQRKGPNRPIVPESDRLKSVAGRNCVDAAFILGTVDDFGQAVKLLGIKYIFKNQEYQNIHILGSNEPGVEVVIVPDFQRTESTSALIEKILRNHIKPTTA